MAGLACMLKNLGNEVIGCDDAKVYTFTEDALYENDIKVYKDAYFLTSDMIFIYTAAIHENHYAYKRAKELNCKMYGYFEFIGELTKKYKTICVSGSHGKTTTTALLSHIFKNTIKTNYLIGDGTGFVDKTSSNFVVESCEFERHFLNYYPKYAIITNIDYDHVDCYKSPDEYREVFGEFIKNVRKFDQYKYTPILMLTTESQDEKKMEGKAAGASGWLVKPFNPTQLLDVVKRFLN